LQEVIITAILVEVAGHVDDLDGFGERCTSAASGPNRGGVGFKPLREPGFQLYPSAYFRGGNLELPSLTWMESISLGVANAALNHAFGSHQLPLSLSPSDVLGWKQPSTFVLRQEVSVLS
jgi:hypothetical protein